MAETRLVAKEPVPVGEFTDVATRSGWTFDRRATRAAQKEESPSYIWKVAGGKASLVQDRVLDLDYFVVDMREPATVTAILSDAFPCYGVDELVDMIRNAASAEESAQAFVILGPSSTSSSWRRIPSPSTTTPATCCI